jgi:hypothetical protein
VRRRKRGLPTRGPVGGYPEAQVWRMRKRQLAIGVVMAGLIAGASGYVVAGMHLYAQYQSAYAQYDTVCGNLVTWSPPAVIYSAFYQNQPSFVTLRYSSPTPQALRISLSIPQFTQVQTVQVNAGPGFQQVAMKPPLLNSSVLDALVNERERSAEIDLSVQGPRGSLCDTSIPVVLKSPEIMHWYDSVHGDNSRYLAGWVTGEDPSILTLIHYTADWLNSHPGPPDYDGVTSLVGYAGGRATPDVVRQQVDAIFDTLQFGYRLHYAQDNVPFDSDAEQLVQLPRYVLPSGKLTGPGPTAMCVETTVIMASAVENLGMRPYIVIVPGHAFLGVALSDSPSAQINYWETSFLGSGQDGNQANIYADTTEYPMYLAQHQILARIDVEAERAQGIEPIE